MLSRLYSIFTTAVRGFFANAFNFKGTTSRNEFWSAILFIIVSTLTLSIIALLITLNIPLLHDAYYIPDVYSLLLLVPSITLLVRRVRDTGLSLWWLTVYFIPIIGIIMLFIIVLMPSKRMFPLF